MATYKTASADETKKLGARLAKTLTGVIALTGDLGSGKTTFVQGFAKGLGIKTKILSPTFVLVRQHPVPHSKKILYHIDLYRLENNEHIKHSGIEELINNTGNIVLIEWAEKAKTLLPKDTHWITFKNTGDNSREILID